MLNAAQVAAGLTTGALGILIASPTDLVKVRMQAESGDGPKRYPNARAAYGIIVRCALQILVLCIVNLRNLKLAKMYADT